MLSIVKAVIFDFNGVLFWDTHLHDEVWKQYAKKLRDEPVSDEEMQHKFHGRTNKDVLEYLAGKSLTPDEIKHHTDAKEAIYRQLCLDSKDEFRLAPGATEYLNYLVAQNIPRTIATGSEATNLQFFYDNLDLAKWFNINLVVFDDGSFAGKPAPDMYLKAAKLLKFDPVDCMVIEDARQGIASAHAAGIGQIVALAPIATQAEFIKLDGVTKVITDFHDLL